MISVAHPAYSDQERQDRETFLALMWALSHPGREQKLPTVAKKPPFVVIAEALLDLETSYFTRDAALAGALSATGARALPVDRAAYHFYPQVEDADLAVIERATLGTPAYPDESATLILGCSLGEGPRLTLSGPGIKQTETVLVRGIPPAFWTLRQQTTRFPLGWDVFLVTESRVIGIPRSTSIESTGN